jgi:DNA-binding MurR/RpiR family transcriptional regulator
LFRWNGYSILIDSAKRFVIEGVMNLHEPVPRDFDALRGRIVARAGELPRRLTQVAAYALEHPDEIAFGTAASIAAAAQVQPSTLVRFAQAMGYQGFSELQQVFQARLRERVLNYEERLEQLRSHALSASKPAVLLQGFADAARKSLEELNEKLDAGRLEEAVSLLAGVRRIYVLGLRRSFAVAASIAYSLSNLGVANTLVDATGGMGPEVLGFSGKDDALLAVSFAPYASETISLVQAAAARGVPVVAITDSPFSPLAGAARLWFEVAEANFEGFRSMTATMTLAMTLTVAIAEKRGAR